MKINIGTKSPTKVRSIEESLKNYEFLKNSSVKSFRVESEVSDQPMTLEETIMGAKNRAKNAFNECDLSFGIESGIMPIPGTKTGYMNVTVCSVYDGKDFHLGLASLFEYPKKVVEITLSEGIEISDAFKKSGLTDEDKIGYSGGGIGFVTNGRVKIVDYYKQAITNALAHVENPHLYK